MKSSSKLAISLFFTVLLAGVLLAPAVLRAEFPFPEARIFPQLAPYVGNYTSEQIYDVRLRISRPPTDDISAEEMAKVDPKTLPYPILIEKEWENENYYRTHVDDFTLLSRGKKGSPVALAFVNSGGGWDKALMARLADYLTHPGWAFGMDNTPGAWYSRGFYLGDGRSIYLYNATGGGGQGRLAALAGYPEAMAESGMDLGVYGFCPVTGAWAMEAALRGYEYAWSYVAHANRYGCPEEGTPPDLYTAYAAYDILCNRMKHMSMLTGGCGERGELAKQFTEEQLAQAKARAVELSAEYDATQAKILKAQRERIKERLPAVVEAINKELDKVLNGETDRFFKLTREETQRLRDL